MRDPDTSDPAPPICWFCGEPEVLDIGDMWTDSNSLHAGGHGNPTQLPAKGDRP